MSKKFWLGLMALVLGANLAQADPNLPADQPKWHMGQRIQEIYSQLNLTDAQKQQLEANKQDQRDKMGLARRAMKADREALRVELMKPQLDAARIHTIDEQIKTIQDQMEDIRLNSILAVRNILTADQFLKFTALMHRMKEERHDND